MYGRNFFSALMWVMAATAGGVAFIVEPSAAIAATKALSAKVGKPLQEAQELLKKNNASSAKAALAKISEAEAASSKSAYETSIINQLRVQAYAQLGDNNNMAKAAEAVLAAGQVSAKEAAVYRQAAAQGYLNAGNTAKFAEYAKGDPDMQALLAQSYLHNGDYKNASKTMKDAIQDAKSAGKSVDESWYKLLLSAQYKGGDMAGYNETMLTLLKINPKPAYWHDILVGLLNQKGLSDQDRLDVYRLFLATNSLAEARDYTDMAQAAIIANSPGDAKRVMDKGFQSGILGKGESAGREKRLQATANAKAAEDLAALPKIESGAAQQPNGDALASIGDGYLGAGQYEKAIQHYQNALAKGGLSQASAVKLHLGIAYAGANNNAKARQTLNNVGGDALHKQLASLWLLTLR